MLHPAPYGLARDSGDDELSSIEPPTRQRRLGRMTRMGSSQAVQSDLDLVVSLYEGTYMLVLHKSLRKGSGLSTGSQLPIHGLRTMMGVALAVRADMILLWGL